MLLAGPAVYSQQAGNSLAFDHLNLENGLSQNSVLSITQDSQGFLWFGTGYGLNRYDGIHFRTYMNDPAIKGSVSGNYIMALLSDTHQTLWIGTTGGLDRYAPEKDAFVRVIGDSAGDDPAKRVNSIYEDRQGMIWVGSDRGLYQMTDRAKGSFRHYTKANLPEVIVGDTVRCIWEDSEGHLWIGSSGGLVRISRKINGSGSFQETLENKSGKCTLFRHIPGNPASLSDNVVTTITEDEGRRLWIGTQSGGINLYRPGSQQGAGSFLPFTQSQGLIHNNVRKIIPYPDGRLWIGTQEGLSVMDPSTGSFHSYQHDPENKKSLSQNSIYSIYRDNSGSVWLGTYFGGINSTHALNTPFTSYQPTRFHSSISNNVVSSFAEDDKHNIWIGTEGGGLNYFNRANGTFTAYRNRPEDPYSLGSNLVKTVLRDREGILWIGTHRGGLNQFDPQRGRFHKIPLTKNDPAPNTGIVALLEDETGSLWVGTGVGLFVSDTRKQEFRHCAFPITGDLKTGLSTMALMEDRSGNIWIGTTNGLFIVKKENREIIRGTGIGTAVNCISEDSRGKVWLGLFHGGLGLYDIDNGTLVSYKEKEGLANNNVVGILEDSSGILWISTENGLSRFDVGNKHFRNYTASDGLAANAFNYHSSFRDSRGEMFFGGYNGFTSFFPSQIGINYHSVPLVITGLEVFDKPLERGSGDGFLEKNISQTERVRLRYDQNVFNIRFALLSYIRPGKNRYAYKLDGFDKDWTYTAAASATYMNLPAGNYTFFVKGANNDGIWSEPARLSIVVLPPFWKTWWAYCLYLLTAVIVLFFITRFFFLRELLKREDALHQAKLNFFTNISHEIRTHLALIVGPIEKLLRQEKPEREGSAESRQLLHVRKNAESLLQLVGELMDFRKAETGNLSLHVSRGNIVSFVEDIYLSFQHLASGRNITADFVSTSPAASLYFDREQLEKVFFNLLSNAFKFTPDGGTISVLIEEKKDWVTIRIIDNGKGIAPHNLSRIFRNYFQENDYGKQNTGYGIGLSLAKHIVELHKGVITVESVPEDRRQSSGGQGPAEGSPSGNRTCFTVSLRVGQGHFRPEQFLPAADAGMQRPDDAARQGDEEGREKAHGKRHTILLVEDNAEVRAFVRESLEGQYEIVESADGLAGWTSATALIPDLVISDVMMPEMDGFTLCGKLKTDERTSHIPVILLTAKTSSDSHVSGLESGADIYLTKPFSIRILILHIQNLLSARERLREKYSRELLIGSTPVVASTVDEQFLEKIVRVTEENMDNPEFGVPWIATEMAMSQPVLYKKLKALTDLSVNDFIKSIRMKKAADLLRQGTQTVSEVAYTVGFSDRKYFSREFKKQFGKTPSEYAESL